MKDMGRGTWRALISFGIKELALLPVVVTTLPKSAKIERFTG